MHAKRGEKRDGSTSATLQTLVTECQARRDELYPVELFDDLMSIVEQHVATGKAMFDGRSFTRKMSMDGRSFTRKMMMAPGIAASTKDAGGVKTQVV